MVERGLPRQVHGALHLAVDRPRQGQGRVGAEEFISPRLTPEEPLLRADQRVEEAVHIVVHQLEELVLRQGSQGIGGHIVIGKRVAEGVVGLVEHREGKVGRGVLVRPGDGHVLKDVGDAPVVQRGGAEGDVEGPVGVVRRDEVHGGPGFDMHQGDGLRPGGVQRPPVRHPEAVDSPPQGGQGFPSSRRKARRRKPYGQCARKEEGEQFSSHYFHFLSHLFCLPNGVHSIRPESRKAQFSIKFL